MPDATMINFGSNEINKCQVGQLIESVLRDVVAESELVFRKSLQQTSIAEFSRKIVERLTKDGKCKPANDAKSTGRVVAQNNPTKTKGEVR